MSVVAAAKLAKQPKEEQAKVVKLAPRRFRPGRPTASEARKLARETGRPVIARNGYEYDGRTVEQERAAAAETKIIFQLIGAMENLATMPVSPAAAAAKLPAGGAEGACCPRRSRDPRQGQGKSVPSTRDGNALSAASWPSPKLQTLGVAD